MSEAEGFWWPDLRWQCPRGHFVSEYGIHAEDHFDPFANYYGVRTDVWYVCHGETLDGLPKLIEVKRVWLSTDAPPR